MREIDLTKLLPDIILTFKREQKSVRVPIFLTIPPDLPVFAWNDNSIEILIFKLFNRATSIKDLERPIRISVAEKKGICDLEGLLNILPSRWIEMKIDMQSVTEFGDTLKHEFEDCGYRAEDEWVTEGSKARLIAYSQVIRNDCKLLFWDESHRARYRCIILFPVDI